MELTIRYSHYRRLLVANNASGPKPCYEMMLTRGEAEEEGIPWRPLSKGGRTECRILDADGNVIARGYATCSELDNFNRRIGRLIAEGRAKKMLGMPRIVTKPYEESQ